MEKKTIWDMGRLSVEQYRAAAKMPVVVVLDNVRSLNNIGSLFRTADCRRDSSLRYFGHAAVGGNPQDGSRRRRLGRLAILPYDS